MKVIGTTKISYQIEKVLDSAVKYLVLVSPYLKLNNRLKVKLSDAFKKVDDIFIVYRDNEVKPDEINWLNSFKNVKMFSIKNLHSKIYINENFALVTSMNLYEYSQINNHEIGVKFNSKEDLNEYKEILNEIRIILESEGNNDSFTKIIDENEDYSMGSLFTELNKYSFKHYRNYSKELYEYICDNARKLIDFDEGELYQDKTAVLRITYLGKEKFLYLKEKLKELAN